MKAATNGAKRARNMYRDLFTTIAVLVILLGLPFLLFRQAYGNYTDHVLYAERLGQMQEVTEQLFTGLEDVVNNQWNNVQTQTNTLMAFQPETPEQLTAFLQKETQLWSCEEQNADFLVVDSHGRYYTKNGAQGLLSEMRFLTDSPEKVSFVFSSSIEERTNMVFLQRLPQPIVLQSGESSTKLLYCGMVRDMTELNEYFNCEAYNGKNAVYVLDEQGGKLFTGINGREFIRGYNAFTVLQNMNYLHESSFSEALAGMKQSGVSYSNAVLDGEECYYALYQMQNAAWVLLFMVPSDSVAVNTVRLVASTTNLVAMFAFCLMVLGSVCLYISMYRQKNRELRAAEQSNLVLEAKNTQLQQAQNTTKEALRTAESANRAKTDFLSNMSHDIRTPMNAIVGISNLMQAEIHDPERLQEHIEKLQASSRHLLSLINDILDMSKIEAGKTVLHNESMVLAEQVAQMDNIIHPQAKAKNQTVIFRTEHLQHENVIGDPMRLRQVLLNILSNAVKYTGEGGTIDFLIEEMPKGGRYARYRFVVTDNGIGMTPEFMKHLYDSFSRAENSVTNKVQGTGLGMAITKNIVEMMGGAIHAESEPGKGSCFEVTLEFLIDQKADANIPKMEILTVGFDKAVLAQMQSAVLGKPVILDSAPDAEKAVHWMQSQNYAVVLTAWDPQDSAAAAQNGRLREAMPEEMPLIGAAGCPREEVQDSLHTAGLEGYVSLPFFLSNLEAEIKRIQENRAAAQQSEEKQAPLQGMRFLCAEDNELNAEILSALLEMVGAGCTICRDGKEIAQMFETVQAGEYDMILMDVQMPNMNGLDATRAIRSSKNPLGKTIPIIAMTANAFSDDVQHCLDAGMDAHLAKPVDMKELERTVKRLKKSGGGVSRCRRF